MDLFTKGGPVMVLLLMLSIYVLAAVIYKVYQFWQARVWQRDFVSPVLEDVAAKRFEKAQMALEPHIGPLAEVMKTSLAQVRERQLSQESREAEVTRVGNSALLSLSSHLRGLDLVANIGPLLGLLGTVTGMVQAFSKLQEQGSRVDPSQLAGGIWEALLTTVGGLIVAIPALAAYHLLDGVLERLRVRMKDASVQILAMDDALKADEVKPAEIKKIA